MSIGDAGIPNTDASYAGESGESSLSVQYWRDKITEFQRTLNALDETYRAATDFLAVSGDSQTVQYLNEAISEFDFKRTALKLAAEGVNVAAATINAAGGRFPQLSIPQGLGVAPIVIGAGAVAAIGAAAALTSWGMTWIQGVNERMAYAALMQPNDPEIARILARGKAAQAEAEGRNSGMFGGIGQIAPYIKWGAVALLAYMAWPMIRPMLKGIGGSRKRIAAD